METHATLCLSMSLNELILNGNTLKKAETKKKYAHTHTHTHMNGMARLILSYAIIQ